MKPEDLKIKIKKALQEQNYDIIIGLQRDLGSLIYDYKYILDEEYTNYVLKLATNPNKLAVRQFIMFAAKTAEDNLIDRTMPAILLYKLYDMFSLEQCKEMFPIIEKNVDLWEFLQCRTVLLRLCNKLIERTSKVQDASFRGRVLIFLSILMPFYDRSGCNVDAEFNLESMPVNSESVLDIVKVSDKYSESDLNHFKTLKSCLGDPEKCVSKEHWDTFEKAITSVLNFIKNNEVEEGQCEPEKFVGKIELTNSYLITHVCNSKFRREILVQTLIVFQHISSKKLERKQIESIQANTLEIYSLLEKTPPNGVNFVSTVKKLLEQETRWSSWKSAGCPERPTSASRPLNLSTIPRKRYLGDMLKQESMMGANRSSATVTSEDCKSEDRIVLPTLVDVLLKAAKELAAESTVAEGNRKIDDRKKEWSK